MDLRTSLSTGLGCKQKRNSSFDLLEEGRKGQTKSGAGLNGSRENAITVIEVPIEHGTLPLKTLCYTCLQHQASESRSFTHTAISSAILYLPLTMTTSKP